MPFYYTVVKTPGTPGTAITTNGVANTLSTHFRFLTVASQNIARIMGIFGGARFGTAGGGVLYGIRAGTAGTGGTANTPAKKNPDFPAAATTAFDDATAITAGLTPITQKTIGFAQTGGMFGWVALEVDDGLKLSAGGGANGNFEIGSKANSASVAADVTIDLQEN